MAVMGREQQAQKEIGEFDHVLVELTLNDNGDVEEDLHPARPSKYPAKTHARRVAKLLPSDSGLIYLVGATSELFEDSDMGPKLRQRRYFLYLSGVVDIPDCELLYSISDDHLTLYIPPLDSEKVLWSGMPLSPQQCRLKYDVDTVYTTLSVSDHIAAYHKQNHTAPIYFIHQQTSSIPLNIPKSLLDGTALQPAVDDCRVYKDPYEVSLIRRANRISAAGHKLLMAAVKRARNEAELEAVFTAACIRRQAKVQAYDPIIGAGRNAAFLHYMKNNEPTKGRQLLLADCGAEWEGYASDVTRTYPISGCWTAEAAAIYNIVEEMQRECIKRSVKGVDWRDTQLLAHRLALKGLLRLGIMKGDEEEIFAAGTTKAFFPHGIGHNMGLNVHDVDGTPDFNAADNKLGVYATIDEDISPFIGKNVPRTVINRVLDKDMVITVEPGIYFCEWIIRPYMKHPAHGKYINGDVLERYWDVGGVRIEDDILILEEGNESLTTAPSGAEMLSVINHGGNA